MADFVSMLQNWFRRNDSKFESPAPVLADEDGDLDISIGDVADVWHATAADIESDQLVWNQSVEIESEIESALSESAPAIVNKRPPLVLTVLSGKGGVGKTTTILGIAGVLLEAGEKVLFVDLDPQGSLSAAVLDMSDVATVADCFNGKTLAEVASQSSWRDYKGKAFIVPADRNLALQDAGVDAKAYETTLSARLGDLSEFAAVVVDAPATLGLLTAEAIALASHVVVVAEPSLFSLRAAADAVEFAQPVRKPSRNRPRKLNVILNKLDGTDESNYRSREIKRVLPGLVLKTSISTNQAIHRANGSGVPVQILAGDDAAAAALEFEKLLAEIRAI